MAGARDSAPCQKGAEREGHVAVSKQKGLLPALKSPFVCIYSLFLSIYYMILCFLLSMHKPFLFGNADRLVVGAEKAICFPKYIA